MKELNGYVASIGWVLLLAVALLFSMEVVSVYVSTQGHIAAIGGKGVILSLLAALGIIAIVVGARKFSDDKGASVNYRQA